ncbi:Melanophilin Exophilin-3 [Takifugu flavidus]|uniref:Melanophilin Exophilin-3 n=1 Tax=Takifugu flavidus TaxID=433684 RepID=A0A5C6PPR3_9TELE|nr:Melanophilin Exophilin-3 [Takifugu flavidus]
MSFRLALMPGGSTGKKLDLTKLTDEEAEHVWAVVQRDFDLRKKEEDRLGDLKTKIEKEDTKRELLGNQTRLTESYCIRCLQPFKFLVNTRRQCLDCQLHICKSCSRYNKREQGWVCDPCHMARVLKIGTLEWYHENVRARFKRFGSAKVMRSLFKRLSGDNSNEDGYEEHSMDGAEPLKSKEMKKAKRRLTVDPIDFERECDNESGQRSDQAALSQGGFNEDEGVRASTLTEANLASVFHHILQEQHEDNRTLPSRSVSQLSYSSVGSGSGWGPHYSSSSYLPGPGDSSGEEEQVQPFPFYQSQQGALSHTSQESLNSPHPPPQINDLNSRVSAIENFLNHLEQKVASPYEQWEEADLEEQQLREKLDKMAEHISDHSESSEEEEEEEEEEASRAPEDAKPSRLPVRAASRSSIILSTLEEHQTGSEKNAEMDVPEQRWCPLEEGSKGGFRGSAALLFELEDKVAQAAASVQSAQSEVSYIEDRIAALNAAGIQGDRRRRSAIPVHARRLSHNPPSNQVDRFVRNNIHRGSLTQRNPVAKPKTGSVSAAVHSVVSCRDQEERYQPHICDRK